MPEPTGTAGDPGGAGAGYAVLHPLHTYVDRVDAGDVTAVGDLFTADGVYDVLGTPLHGPDRIVATLREKLSAWERTSHHVGNPLVEVTGSGRAATARISASVYALHLGEGGTWHFWGRYGQELVRRGAGWAIARMVLTGIASDPPGDPALFTGHPDRRPVRHP